ncbi:MAG: Hint domain-containing protein [Rhodobacteraceae bacterium]|nr:Hint domain-containing protein [Paracoccaceae bacterium]
MTLYHCDVFPRADFIATWGVNDGDSMGSLATCAEGDIYTLCSDGVARSLTLDLGDPITLVQDDPGISPALPSGGVVRPEGRILLMANDGEIVELVALSIAGHGFLLPLNPIRAGLGYALIEVKTEGAALLLAQTVLGCFGTGTRITLADGQLVPIEDLTPGVKVLTRDHGAQPLRWVGQVSLRGHGQSAPVIFPAGVLGNLAPLTLAPRQRIFLYQRGDNKLGQRAEVLIQAQFLVGSGGIEQRETGFVTYHALAFDTHQIIYAEGVPMESLLVSRATMTQLPAALQSDLERRFPDLDQHAHFAQNLPRSIMTAATRARLLQR